MPKKQYKILVNRKKQENVKCPETKRQSIETTCKMNQILELADKEFKVANVTITNEMRKNMLVMNEILWTLCR